MSARSVVKNSQRLREFGAAARQMLEQAAARLAEIESELEAVEGQRKVSAEDLRSSLRVQVQDLIPIPVDDQEQRCKS